jgi:hypothetical protein
MEYDVLPEQPRGLVTVEGLKLAHEKGGGGSIVSEAMGAFGSYPTLPPMGGWWTT